MNLHILITGENASRSSQTALQCSGVAPFPLGVRRNDHSDLEFAKAC
jgi:hypothetical protein